jgi:hypothetical protein
MTVEGTARRRSTFKPAGTFTNGFDGENESDVERGLAEGTTNAETEESYWVVTQRSSVVVWKP